jgi:hypothetical protein
LTTWTTKNNRKYLHNNSLCLSFAEKFIIMQEGIIVMSEAQLTGIIENTIRKVLNKSKDESKPKVLTGCRAAVAFLEQSGYDVSLSLMQKETAAGTVPCSRFHNKRLVFNPDNLLGWAESHCKPVGDMSEVTLSLASDANSKLRKLKGRK